MMSTKMKRLLSVSLILLVTTASIFGYGMKQEAISHNDGKLDVTVTTTFLGDAVSQIGGEYVEVTRLMGPGVDPHQYQASSSDLTKLTSADVVFYAGLHLEAKLGDILEKLSEAGKPIVNTSRSIPKSELLYAEALTPAEIAELTEDEGVYDPHIWFDVNLWRLVSKEVMLGLQTYDPTHAAIYEANYWKYMASLDELEVYVMARIQEIPEQSRYLVTAHDAFNYFSRYTGMSVRGIQGINTTVEAGTSDVSDTAKFIAEHNIKAIFVESSVSPKLVQALQEAVVFRGGNTRIGGEIYSDSSGELGTPEGTYVGMYKHNVDVIVDNLK